MGLIDYNQLPSFDLFGIFTLHFVLSTWGILGYWSPDAYLYYNAVFLFVLVWCIRENQSEIPLILAIRINLICIVFDVLIILTNFSYLFWKDLFSVVGGICNLLLRFITVPLLSKMSSDRTGGLNDGLPPVLSPIFGIDYNDTAARDRYEDIDTVRQGYPRNETSTEPTMFTA